MTLGVVSNNIGAYGTTTKTQTRSSSQFTSNMRDGENAYSPTVSRKVESENLTSQELYYQQSGISCTDRIPAADTNLEQTKDLGIGFLLIGNFGYGMSAKQIIDEDLEDVIVRVKIAKGENSFETVDVNLSEVDPGNATAVEMFALCQYADANETGVNDKWGSWHALKAFSAPFGQGLDIASLEEAKTKKGNWNIALSASNYFLLKESTGETLSAADMFKILKETIIEGHKLTPDNIKREDDWREMDDEQWKKLIEHIDKYIDDFKEKLEHMEEIREEAVMKAMAEAPADMRAAAASMAMLNAMCNGIAGGEPDCDISYLEKISWTYEMQTDDQVILATAKMANEFAPNMISKSQEMGLIGDTSVGIGETENVKECASVTGDLNKKVWTITVFGQDGIICKQCTMDGESKELWRLDYQNAEDAEKIWNFLDRFDKDAELKFAGSKEFWENFLAGNISGDKLRASHEATFEQVGPNAPESVKKAWLEAAEEVRVNGLGAEETEVLSHITELDIQRFTQWSKGQYDTDVLGTTAESAINAIKKAIDAMDHSLTQDPQKTEEVRKARVKEREFYEEFLDRLETISLVNIPL